MDELAGDLELSRFLLLLEQIGDEYGRPKRGWQRRVSERTDVDPSIVSKLLVTGGRSGVGRKTIKRAVAKLKLDRAFLTDPDLDSPQYKNFLKGAKPRAPLPRVEESMVSYELDPETAGEAALQALSSAERLDYLEFKHLEQVVRDGLSATTGFDAVLAELRGRLESYRAGKKGRGVEDRGEANARPDIEAKGLRRVSKRKKR